MNNIPENILQAVADAAFDQSPSSPLSCVPSGTNWKRQPNIRRAVIQHALDNPALAPFLAGGIGEYTDEELRSAWSAAEETNTLGIRWLRSFLAALPRRESPALAQAIARAEKAEAELATLKSSQLGILRHIAEMSPTVPDGCIAVTGGKDLDGDWLLGDYADRLDTHFAILRLPADKATPPAKCAINHTEQNVQFRDTAGYCMICGADWPEPAAQVPLGPEDCPPGSTLRAAQGHWFIVLHVEATGVTISNVNGSRFIKWHELKDEGWQINISRPDTGRWDANAWRPCSKPAGKEVAK